MTSVLPVITVPPVTRISPTPVATTSYITTSEQVLPGRSIPGTNLPLSTVTVSNLPAVSVPALTTRQTIVIPPITGLSFPSGYLNIVSYPIPYYVVVTPLRVLSLFRINFAVFIPTYATPGIP